ncbi:MAG: type I DNA topoisomerase [bacterium]|nr:type I DNA topoisomerase [bacterium]
MKNLVIVESPAKAKTIEKYLGKDFTVMSSVGHIRAIAKKNKAGADAIETENGYKTTYEVDSAKKKTVAELRKAVKSAEEVWLATDEDREGEAIAWHLTEVLKLPIAKTKRIVFHEITKSAILEAIQNPRTIDMKMVQAQQARQILDRLVGFELSPVVWKKVPGGKSAGRVQSPAVKLLVEREREIDAFNGKSSFKITGEFASNSGETIKAELNQKFDTEEKAQDFLAQIKDAHFTVSSVSKSPASRNPSAPFTTSTLQQEANARLGFSAKTTMSAAQKLYQSGQITYMRTDSVNLSAQALAASAAFIKETFGENYHHFRTYKTKSAGAQEAHEAIRPTNIAKEVATGDQYAKKLYGLIRARTLASQMAPAQLEKTVVSVDISGQNYLFEAKGEVAIFDGFLKVYASSKKDEFLPTLNSGEALTFQEIIAKEVFQRPPARYTEGSLVKKLEDLGIGRPSTYATIIDTIQVRGYAEKGESEGQPRDAIQLKITPDNDEISKEILQEKSGSTKGKLVPTHIGGVMSDFLNEHFNQVVDYGWTANLENDFDKIATGEEERNTVLDEFYKPFHKLILESGGIDRSQVSQARELGVDPKTGKKVFARFGRFGPMIQLGDNKIEGEEVKFAPMPAGLKIETVSLQEALKMFQLPRTVGTTSTGEEIKANIGRFGPYIQVGKLFVSIKPLSPFEITEEEARMLYEEKLKAEANKNIADFGDGIKIINGRFGPYITDGTKNVKIPKDQTPSEITHEQARALLTAAPDKKSRTTTKKTTAKKSTAKKTSTKKKSTASKK